MDPMQTDIFDHSTPKGRFHLFLARINWAWVTGFLLISALIGLPFLYAGIADGKYPISNSLQLPLSGPSTSQVQGPVGSAITYLFDGPDEVLVVNFTGYDEISSLDKTLVQNVTVKNVYLDAFEFSSSLEGLSNLQHITLRNVRLVGNFSRVYLPSLLSFYYQQHRDDKRDSYKSPASLKTTLFFEKSLNSSWDVEKDLLNLHMFIKVAKGGTKLIEINPSLGDVYLNVKYGQDVLKNAQGLISTLTLINCNVTEELPSFIPKTVKYLNLRNTIPSSLALSQILQGQTKLVEFYGYFNFHCDWPGWEVYLNISELPKTVRTVGVNNMDLSSSPGFKSSVVDFTVGDFISPKVVEDFDKIFPNLKQVRIVNITSSSAYPLLTNALKTKASTIELIYFERIGYNVTEGNDGTNVSIVSDATLPQAQLSVDQIEMFLSNLGIDKTATDILIERTNSGATAPMVTGRPLSELEWHYSRYKGLAFDKMDTWEDYLLWDALKLSSKADKIFGGIAGLVVLQGLVVILFTQDYLH